MLRPPCAARTASVFTGFPLIKPASATTICRQMRAYLFDFLLQYPKGACFLYIYCMLGNTQGDIPSIHSANQVCRQLKQLVNFWVTPILPVFHIPAQISCAQQFRFPFNLTVLFLYIFVVSSTCFDHFLAQNQITAMFF